MGKDEKKKDDKKSDKKDDKKSDKKDDKKSDKKKEAKKDTRNYTKDQKKDLKKQKNVKHTTQKTQVAQYSHAKNFNNPTFANKIQENNNKAKTGALGQSAKTASEEWAQAGKAAGLQIWRVEKFNIVAWPRTEYGHFYNGDSYIVLNTVKAGNAFKWDIHFWLGEKTSQDEAGTAAYKTVELDNQLGGTPVQHREVQDFESQLFLSYFQPSIQILHGGIDSGFNQVKPEEFRTRLLHLKGKTNVRVREVHLSSESLNAGDVFVLDAGLKIFQWNGSSSSVKEKTKGGEVVRAIKEERKGQPKVANVEQGHEDAEFWQLIGGQGPIATAEEGGDDLSAEKMATGVKVLFQLSDASGSLTMTEKARGKISKALLDPKDVFILDTGLEVFAWIGKQTSTNEKNYAISYAQDYLVKAGKPPFLPVTRVVEGGESESFISALDK